MIDEKQLRLSTNPQVQATLLLIDEVRQLKEVLSKDSNLVFLDGVSNQTNNVLPNQISIDTSQSDKPRGTRKPRKKVDK